MLYLFRIINLFIGEYDAWLRHESSLLWFTFGDDLSLLLSEAFLCNNISMKHYSFGVIDLFYGEMHWGVTPIDHFINKMMHHL